MTEEQLKRAKQIDEELKVLREMLYVFSGYNGAANDCKRIPLLGQVRRKRTKKGWALYTLNDSRKCPVRELVLPESIKYIMYTELKKYKEELEKELELL